MLEQSNNIIVAEPIGWIISFLKPLSFKSIFAIYFLLNTKCKWPNKTLEINMLKVKRTILYCYFDFKCF